MTKKQLRLSKDVAKKSQGYIPGGLNELIKEVKINEKDENFVRMNFEVSEILRNAFKAKVASQGKRVKDVLATFMTEYVKNYEENIK